MISAFNAILVEEADRFDGDLYERSLQVSPWIDLPQVGTWPEGMGEAISLLVYERSIPGAPNTWTQVSGTDSTGKSILPNVNEVSFGRTLREYNLQHTALQSPKLNLNDLASAVMRNEQMNAIRNILADNTNWLLQNRNRSEYLRLAKNHIVLNSGGNQEGATVPEVASNQELTNQLLTRYRQRLIRAGGGKNPLDRVDNKPIFGLICEEETSEALKAELDENLRYDGRANELLAPLGVEGVYKNFFHICDSIAPRYNFVSGNASGQKWVEVLPYSLVADGFGGFKLIENPAYETATHTDSIIYHADVMEVLYPNPGRGVGNAGGASFDPVQYRGQWKWLNVVNVDSTSPAYNPDGTIGFFRGVFAQGSRPVFPEFGYRFRHLRSNA